MAKQKDKITRKTQHEIRVVQDMIALYCRGVHGGKELCDECRVLSEYAVARTLACPHMESKSFCSQCRSHCYRKDMRERIREVMRYAGPRMIFHHPIAAVRHLYYSKIKAERSKRKVKFKY